MTVAGGQSATSAHQLQQLEIQALAGSQRASACGSAATCPAYGRDARGDEAGENRSFSMTVRERCATGKTLSIHGVG
jgi:hypothetical protein